MTEAFFKMTPEQRRDILDEAFNITQKSTAILEKDIWLVWTLDQLFKMPDAPAMTFKGGTALSKVFNVIDRFSEDADITVNYLDLDPSLNFTDLGALSKTKQKGLSDNLKTKLKEFSTTRLVPYLENCLRALDPNGQWRVAVDISGENVQVYFPSVATQTRAYALDYVLIELGGRNPIDPSSVREISTELEKAFPSLAWPRASVNVLSPKRTFWEKVTLIHVECHRPQAIDFDRKFRHWFDLVKLADSEFGEIAASDLDMLHAVVTHKAVFYSASYANYPACLLGQLRLVPIGTTWQRLRDDWQKMLNEGMFFDAPPHFDTIMARIQEIETGLNQRILANQEKTP